VSDYYRGKRTRNLYTGTGDRPYKLSRSKIDLYLNCPRCFYIDRRLGLSQPPGYPFNLNSAVDELLKRDFDRYRRTQTPHPLMEKFGIEAVPFQHDDLEDWRNSTSKGIQFHHEQTNLLITGGVDDVWEGKDGALYIVDYKATSKTEDVNLDAPWQISYKRQMEIYQWLFEMNGFNVNRIGYFVYCNGKRDKPQFANRLEFDVTILPYAGTTSWIEAIVAEIFECLNRKTIPERTAECDYCIYTRDLEKLL
jgi:CRISPR/Cas system-associated exonuclease Cas4 (RecB family)